MTKLHPPRAAASPQGNAHGPKVDEAGLPEAWFVFPGEQFFDEIMHEKMRPRKVAKFKMARAPEKDA